MAGMRLVALVALALFAIGAAAACTPPPSRSAGPTQLEFATPSAAPNAGPSAVAEGSIAPRSSLTLADAASCPVTKPVPAPSSFSSRLFGAASASGNDALWVGGLGDNGIILVDRRFLEPDGTISWKLGWYRIEPGTLTIAGRRLDAGAPPLRSDVPTGYGEVGFQATGVEFPTEGCWEVTGTLGAAHLTFVVFVLRTD